MIVGVLWLCFSPFLVMGRTESMEKRLEERIRALEKKIDAARIGFVPSTSPEAGEMPSAESMPWAPTLVVQKTQVLKIGCVTATQKSVEIMKEALANTSYDVEVVVYVQR